MRTSPKEWIVKALKNRLDREADHSPHQVSLRHKEGERLRDLTTEMRVQEHEVEKGLKINERSRKRLEEEEQIKSMLDNMYSESNSELRERNKRIEFLESETDSLRDDRNEHKACSQQLLEELWDYEEHGRREEGEDANAEAAESNRIESGDSKSRISRREADKVVVPPWPKSHDLDGSTTVKYTECMCRH